MCDRVNLLASKLQVVNYDLNRLSEAKRTDVFALARGAGVQLPRPGTSWPSSPGAVGEVTAPRKTRYAAVGRT